MKRGGELRRGKPLTPSPKKAWKPKRKVVAVKDAAYALVEERSQDECEMCGRWSPSGQREHSHRSHGGFGGSPASLRASNLLLSCVGPFGCNRALSDDPDFAEKGRKLGWLISRGADPQRTPVYLWSRGWVLLDDAGHYRTTEGDN